MQLLKTLALLSVIGMSAMVAAVAAKDLRQVSTHTLLPHSSGEFYRTAYNGYLMIKTAEGDKIISCSITGWRQQDIYHRHNLPLLAEGCVATGVSP